MANSPYFEHLLTEALRERLAGLRDPALAKFEKLEPDEFAALAQQYCRSLVRLAFAEGGGLDRSLDIVAGLQKLLSDYLPEGLEGQELVRFPEKPDLLRAVFLPETDSPESASARIRNEVPQQGFTFPSLFTGTNSSVPLVRELKREILSAGEVLIIISFIRWSGLKLLLPELEAAVRRGIRVRVLTSVYLGATEFRCIEELHKLGAEVRISYNTLRGRLHAKAWIFGRENDLVGTSGVDAGLGTAYVGSSNVSRDALQDGSEWNVRITQREVPGVYSQLTESFEALWEDTEFEVYTEHAAERVKLALASAPYVKDSWRLSDLPANLRRQVLDFYSAKNSTAIEEAETAADQPTFSRSQIEPYPFQEEILERIEAERLVHRRYRNLVVVPTGAGKTIIAAFDYKRISSQLGRRPRLLFVAHRIEILEQARRSFRRVLGTFAEFGEVWQADNEPKNWDYLFASVQTLTRRKDELFRRWPEGDWFEYIVVDEAHHGAAASYRVILDQLRPRFLLGLTATPERMDGSDIVADFDGHFAAEMRLSEGIRKGLLAPFHYFGIGEDAPDLSHVRWSGRYDVSDLERKLVTEPYAEAVLSSLRRICADHTRVRALGFCATIVHAQFMATWFEAQGLAACALTSQNTTAERSAAIRDIADGELQYLFTVDLFNEGVDIPSVDTVIFLRPTESLTVFLQQLGRGLRNYPGKDVLTVVDFVGNAHKNYDFTHKFRAMLGVPSTRVQQEIRDGFPSLPADCAIVLDQESQSRILAHIENQIPRGRAQFIRLIAEHGETSVDSFLKESGFEPEFLVSKAGLWYQIQDEIRNRGLAAGADRADDLLAEFVFSTVLATNSVSACERWKTALEVRDKAVPEGDALWLCHEILGNRKGQNSPWERPADLWSWLHSRLERVEEIKFWLDYQRDRIEVIEEDLGNENLPGAPILKCFANYTWPGIKWALGLAAWDRMPVEQAGVNQVKDAAGNVVLRYLIVTVHKAENLFTQETMYRDWALSRTSFQWDSPNSWTPDGGQGRAFLDQLENGVPVYLFVRETKKDEYLRSRPFLFMGPVTLVEDSVRGAYPFSLRLNLQQPMPVSEYRRLCMPVAG